jgi:hypothetical protein
MSDERCRLQSRDLFKPNTPYDAEPQADGSVRLVELVPKDVPIVRARKLGGRWVGAAIKLNRKAIVEAIRQDRESR